MKNKKKVLSIILTVLLVVSLIPTNTFIYAKEYISNNVIPSVQLINNKIHQQIEDILTYEDSSIQESSQEASTKGDKELIDDEIEFEPPQKAIIGINDIIEKNFSYTSIYTGSYIQCPGVPTSEVPSGGFLNYQGYGASPPSFKDPGEYIVYYVIELDYDLIQHGSITFNIVGGSVTYTKSNYSGTYDGNSHTGSVSVSNPSSGSTITYSTSSGGTYSGTKPTRTNAGTTTVYFKITATGYTETTGSFTITINKANMTVSKSDYSGVYDGSAHSGSVKVTKPSSGATINYGTTSGSYTTTTKPTRTNVGTTTVYYKVTNSNYNDSTGSFTITITNATMTVNKTNYSGTYDGNAHTGSVSVTKPTSGATIKYGTASGTYNLSSAPTRTAAGTQTVYYQVTASNYTEVTGSFSITINKANLTANASDVNVPYDGNAHSGTVNVTKLKSSDSHSIQYSVDGGAYSTTNPSFTDVCEHTIAYKVTSSNYNDATGSFKITITKIDLTANASDVNVPYNGNAHSGTVNVTKLKSSDSHTIQYSVDGGAYSTTNPSFTDVCEHTIDYKVTSSNYNDATGRYTIKITTAEIDATPNDYNAPYDGEEHSGSVSVNVAGAVTPYIVYSTTLTGEYTSSIPQFSQVGEYPVYYQITCDNYNDTSGQFTVTITKANITVNVEDIDVPYDGNSHSATVNITKAKETDEHTIEYSIDGGEYSTTNPSFTTVCEHTISYRITAGSNYNDASGTYTIRIYNAQFIDTPNNYEGVYDGEEHTGSVDVEAEGDAIPNIVYAKSLEGEYSDDVPKFTNIGVHTVYYKITCDNHDEKTGTFTVTINKANIITSAENIDLVYDGNAHSAIVNVTKVKSDDEHVIEYSVDGGEYSTTNPTYTDVCNHTIDYRVTSDNYNDATGTYTIKITEAEIVASHTPYIGVYDGNEHTGSISVTEPTMAYGYEILYSETPTGTYSSTIPQFTDVGEYPVYYKINAVNYAEKTGDFLVTITKANIAISVENLEVEYDGNPHSEDVLVTTLRATDEYELTYIYDGAEYTTSPQFTNVGTYTVNYRIISHNYNDVTDAYTIMITKSTIIASAENVEFIHDDEPHSGTVVVTRPTTECIITYSTTKEGTYTAENPAFTEIADYTVYYIITDPNGNYNDFEGSFKVSIIPAFIRASAENVDVVYDGLPHTGTVNVTQPKSGYTIYYSLNAKDFTTDNPEFVNVTKKPQIVYYKIEGGKYITETGFFTVKINKVQPVAYADNVEVIYDGEMHYGDVQITYPEHAAEYTILYRLNGEKEWSEESPGFSEEGVYNILYKVEGDNYYTYSSSFTISIIDGITAKANDVEVTYDGSAHTSDVILSKDVDNATITYATSATGTYTPDKPTFTNAGEYVVHYKVTIPDMDDIEGSFSVTINKADMIVVAVDRAYKYDGTAKMPSIQVKKPTDDYTITYSLDDETYSSDVPELIEIADYTVHYKVVSDNYNVYTGSVGVVINNLEVVKASALDVTAVYDGGLHTSDVTVTEPTSDFAITYSEDGDVYSDDKPSYRNVGEYTVYYKVKAEGYNDYVGTFDVRITTATLEVEAEDIEVTYDSLDHFADVIIKTENLENLRIEYSTDDIKYSTTKPSCVNPDTYTIYYKVSADNYEPFTGIYTITINKADLEVSAEDLDIRYDGNPHSGSIEIKTAIEDTVVTYSVDDDSYSEEIPVFVEPGTYTVYYKVNAIGYNEFRGQFTVNISNVQMVESVPIYRVYNPNSTERVWTSKKGEYDKLGKIGWKQEGIAFYAYDKPVVGGTPIYRIFNPKHPGGDHHYTKSVGEARKRVAEGWKWDFGGNPVFCAPSDGEITVYKLYDRGRTYRHIYTASSAENNSYGKKGWIQEGIAWYSVNKGEKGEVKE